MASKLDSFTSSLVQRLDEELLCGICLEIFSVPLLLPCGHNFCQECLIGLIENARSYSFISLSQPSTFNCPVCQAIVGLGNGSLDHLPNNRVLENIVLLYKDCSPVNIFDEAWSSDKLISPTTCKEHKLAEDRFCKKCNVAACGKCLDNKHSKFKMKHQTESLMDNVTELQAEISDVLTCLKKELIPLVDRIKFLEEVLAGIKLNEDQVKNKLELYCSSLMATVRAHQEELKRQVDSQSLEDQYPIKQELDKCKAVQTMSADLMNKLSKIRKGESKNNVLKLQRLKDLSIQLNNLLCQDIPGSLENPMVPQCDLRCWDLDISQVTAAVSSLTWSTRIDETSRKMVSMETQTDSQVTLKSKISSKNCQKYMEEVDSSTPLKEQKKNKNLNLKVASDSMAKKKPGTCFVDTETNEKFSNKLKQKAQSRKHNAEVVLSSDSKEINTDDEEHLVQKTAELKLTTAASPKAFTRQSYPPEMTEMQTMRLDKSKPGTSCLFSGKPRLNETFSEGSFRTPPKSANSQALEQFIARRRTLSPSASSPAALSVSEDQTLTTPKGQDCGTVLPSSLNKKLETPDLNGEQISDNDDNEIMSLNIDGEDGLDSASHSVDNNEGNNTVDAMFNEQFMKGNDNTGAAGNDSEPHLATDTNNAQGNAGLLISSDDDDEAQQQDVKERQSNTDCSRKPQKLTAHIDLNALMKKKYAERNANKESNNRAQESGVDKAPVQSIRSVRDKESAATELSDSESSLGPVRTFVKEPLAINLEFGL